MDGPLPQDASETDTGAAILDEALARFGTTEDARLREIMLSLIRHAHAFVRETKLTWDEWERGMAFFATAARVTGPGRNEFIALSNSIGVSMQVLAVSQPKPAGATIPTLIGPFFIDEIPGVSCRGRYFERRIGRAALCLWAHAGYGRIAGRGRRGERVAVRRSRLV